MSLEELRTIFSGFTLISVIFVVLNYWLSRNKTKQDLELTKDKEICEQAIIAIERAYTSLTSGKVKYEIPDASRLNWLTSARQITRFKELKIELKTDLYQLVCSEHEEHWKHEFYLSLKHNEFISPSYFQSNNIELTSALVVINFKQWEPGAKDPLDDIDANKLINDGYTLKGQHGLRKAIEDSLE
jgi:hypothetical protein